MKQIIKRPLVSEKNTNHAQKGIYVFEVDLGATKKEIELSVQKSFGVKIQSIKTSICRSKAKTNKFGKGKIPYWKKAYVKLNEGEKIALFEGV